MGRRIWVEAPGELLEELEALAAARGMTRSEFVVAALRRQVEEERLGEVLEFSNSLAQPSADRPRRRARG